MPLKNFKIELNTEYMRSVLLELSDLVDKPSSLKKLCKEECLSYCCKYRIQNERETYFMSN